MYDLKPSVIEEEIGGEEEESWEPQFRPETPRLPLEDRKRSFKEIELSFSEDKARQEARRCLRCDLEK
jgi:hypothetical protein